MTEVQSALSADPWDRSASVRHQAAVEILSRAPVSLLWTLAADSSLPASVQPPVAAALVRAAGLHSLRRIAGKGSRHRRIGALRALVLADPNPVWSLLAAALQDRSPQVVGATVTLLGQIDHRCAAELLCDALRLGRHSRSRIATALEGFPRGVPDVLMSLLWSDDPQVRYWAATLMRRYPSHPGLFDQLDVLTTDPNALVRKAALDSLADLGDARGTTAAERRLTDPVFFVRAHAVRTLGALGGLKYASAIGRMLADRDWWVRSAAKQTLESFGSDAGPSVIPFLVHPDLFARNSAAEVLQNTGLYGRYLVEEATGRVDRYRRDVLLLLADAGGRQMWNGQMARLSTIVRVRNAARTAAPAAP